MAGGPWVVLALFLVVMLVALWHSIFFVAAPALGPVAGGVLLSALFGGVLVLLVRDTAQRVSEEEVRKPRLLKLPPGLVPADGLAFSRMRRPRAKAGVAVLAATIVAVQVSPARATGIRGSWAGVEYARTGLDRGSSDPVIVRVQHLRVGQRAGRVTLPGIGGDPTCHGPIRYLGRSPRGGYRFLYRETNDAAVASDDCGVASHILLVPHGARLFMRDSDRHWYPKTGGVSLGWLTRRPERNIALTDLA